MDGWIPDKEAEGLIAHLSAYILRSCEEWSYALEAVRSEMCIAGIWISS